MNTTYQLTKINRALHTERDGVIRERLLLVKRFYEDGSFRLAAEATGSSHGRIKYWKDRYEESGLRGFGQRRAPAGRRHYRASRP